MLDFTLSIFRDEGKFLFQILSYFFLFFFRNIVFPLFIKKKLETKLQNKIKIKYF
jgi:hypothetical protein